MYENKITIVIKNDLLTWQKLNVTSFLASSIPIKFPETHGRSLISADGSEFFPFVKQPILIYKANSTEQLKRTFDRAMQRELGVGIYTKALFATRCEEENIAEIAAHVKDALDLIGIVVYGKIKK